MSKKIISFECPDYLYREIESISATTGLSRSELLREGVSEIISHYSSSNNAGADNDQSVRDLIKRALFILEQNKN